jgi:hypothetical protein
MDPLAIRVKSLEEKNALLEKRRELWNSSPPESTHLIARSEEDFVGRFAENIIVEREDFVPARELTTAERTAQDGELLFQQIYGDRATDIDHQTGCAALDELWKAKQDADLQKFLGPAKRVESELDAMVRKAVEDVLAKRGSVPSEHEREGILPRMAAASEGDDSSAARFLRSYVNHDDAGMRRVARELAAADSAAA